MSSSCLVRCWPFLLLLVASSISPHGCARGQAVPLKGHGAETRHAASPLRTAENDEGGLYIVTVPGSSRGALGRVLHADPDRDDGARGGASAWPERHAENVVRTLFHAHTRRLMHTASNETATGLPEYTVPYSFQHAGLASRITFVHVNGVGLGVLQAGVQGEVLSSVAASASQQGTVASFGDRIDLDAEIGGVGGAGSSGSGAGSRTGMRGRMAQSNGGMGGGGIDAEPPKPRTIVRTGSTQSIGVGAAGNASSAAIATGRTSAGLPRFSHVHAVLEETPVSNWALDRIDQRTPALDGTYRFTAAAAVDEDGIVPPGQGVDVYVVDTGVRADHVEFERFTVPGGDIGTVEDVEEGTGTAEPVDEPWDALYMGDNAGDEQVSGAPVQPRVGAWPPTSSRDVTNTIGVTTVPVPSPSPALSVPVSNTRVDMSLGTNTISDQPSSDASDPCHGHGTMVASLAAGTTVGPARGAAIIPIRVIGCSGRFMVVDVLKGLDYALTLAERRRAELGTKAIINLSARCFGICNALDEAAAASREAGVLFMTVAGNEGKDACLTSPSRSPDALAVAATRLSGTGEGTGLGTKAAQAGEGAASSSRISSRVADEWAAFSNWGSCVAVAAPGQMVYGASLKGSGQYAFWSGTSFATPVVAGAAAVLWAQQPQLPLACLKAVLTSGLATTGTLRFSSLPEAGVASGGTPRVVLYLPPWPLPLLSTASNSSAAATGMADSPSSFVWPAVCLQPEPSEPAHAASLTPHEAAMRALLRRPPVTVSTGSAAAAAAGNGLVQEDSSCQPVRNGQHLRWDCWSRNAHAHTGMSEQLPVGMVQAVVELAVDSSRFSNHGLASWALSFVQGDGSNGTASASLYAPRILSALASLRSSLGTGLTSKLPGIALAALEVCVAPLHGATGPGLHCLYLPVSMTHLVNAGLQTGNAQANTPILGSTGRKESVQERWRVASGEEWLIRAYIRSHSADPSSSVSLLRAWSSESLLAQWARVHGDLLTEGLHVTAVRIPKGEIEAVSIEK